MGVAYSPGADATPEWTGEAQRVPFRFEKKCLRCRAFASATPGICTKNAKWRNWLGGRRWTARFVGSAWQWLGLWLGSCFPTRSPGKDEIAA